MAHARAPRLLLFCFPGACSAAQRSIAFFSWSCFYVVWWWCGSTSKKSGAAKRFPLQSGHFLHTFTFKASVSYMSTRTQQASPVCVNFRFSEDLKWTFPYIPIFDRWCPKAAVAGLLPGGPQRQGVDLCRDPLAALWQGLFGAILELRKLIFQADLRESWRSRDFWRLC